MEIISRVRARLSDESQVANSFIQEGILTIQDRLTLRLGVEYLPLEFNSIVVDAVVKMYRRNYYEGISSEKIDTISITFADNILDEYDKEIETYLASNQSDKKRVVRFL